MGVSRLVVQDSGPASRRHNRVDSGCTFGINPFLLSPGLQGWRLQFLELVPIQILQFSVHLLNHSFRVIYQLLTVELGHWLM